MLHTKFFRIKSNRKKIGLKKGGRSVLPFFIFAQYLRNCSFCTMKKNTAQRYKATLAYLYEQLPMFQRVGKTAFKKDLTNIIALCEYLEQPHEKFPSIHIAGTNGKGSTAHLVGAILQASGLNVGLYTSPHYKDFRERIKINGKLISKKYVIDFIAQHKVVFEKIQPSFFEISVALAFDYFAHEKVEIAVIETGLGGRLDSTNIVRPLLSVITNISFDHQQFLGETLPEIAFEKAGIIKANTPVVIGEFQEETAFVFQVQAKKKNAPIYFADQAIFLLEKGEDFDHTIYDIRGPSFQFQDLFVNLKGKYQKKNIVTALQAITILNQQRELSKIKIDAVKNGLKQVKRLTYFVGRWQILGKKPTIICDSAHNKAGIIEVLKQLETISYKQLHFVLGIVKDKDLDKILALLPPAAIYYFVKANIPRGLDARILKERAKNHGLKGRKYISVKNAFKAAKRKANVEDLIYIGGSTFVVAEVI